MGETVREQIVAAIAAKLADMDKLDPTTDPAGCQFSEVFRDPPEGLKTGKTAVAVVLDLTEVKTYLSNYQVEVTMPVDVEVHLIRDKNLLAGTKVNRYLGEVERVLREDITLGDLCVDIMILGTEKSATEGPYDNYVSGVLRCEVRFRHHADDPRERM